MGSSCPAECEAMNLDGATVPNNTRDSWQGQGDAPHPQSAPITELMSATPEAPASRVCRGRMRGHCHWFVPQPPPNTEIARTQREGEGGRGREEGERHIELLSGTVSLPSGERGRGMRKALPLICVICL